MRGERSHFRFALAALALAAAAAGSVSDQDAVLYNVCGYAGTEYALNLSTGNVSDLGSFRNKASALKVSPGFQVTLYSLTGFSGTSETFNASVECLYGTTIGSDSAKSAAIQKVAAPSPSPTASPNATPNATPGPTPTPTPAPSPTSIVALPPSPTATPTPTPTSTATPAPTPATPAPSPTPKQPGLEALGAAAALGAALAAARRLRKV